jgi:hypothetical protein
VLKTSDGKWILFEVATGAQVEHWSVDARVLLANGSHTAEPPEGVEVVPPARLPEHVGVPKAPVVTLFEAKAGDEPPPGVKHGRKA